MLKTSRQSATVVALLLAVLGLTACGSSKGSSSNSVAENGAPSQVVAHVGSAGITKDALNHAMLLAASEDYVILSKKHTLPLGLVSDPPNYGACVANLQAAIEVRTKVPPAGQLLSTCRELNQAVRRQAITSLISAQWLMSLERELGVTASDAEVSKLFSSVRKANFPKEEEFKHYLAIRHMNLADELAAVKLDVLAQKSLHAIESGGKRAYARFVQAGQRWTEQTSCDPGYVVEHCKQYSGPPPGQKATSVVVERLASMITGRCTDLGAC